MRELDKEEKDRLSGDFVMLPVAVAYAFKRTGDGKGEKAPSLDRLSWLAQMLARQVTLYAVSHDGVPIRALDQEDLRWARIIDGGNTMCFRDGRAPIRGLAVARSSLRQAVDAMHRR
jgi:hypothetical protein